MTNPEDLAICSTCGTQFDVPLSSPPKACKICDDPRQFVPPTGQSWTSHSTLLSQNYANTFTPDPHDARLTTIHTSPKFGIGQRAILLETPHGNVLWDCITLLDSATIDFIKSKGGLKAIVISHPHYYTTHVEWGRAFNCPVLLSREDEEWICQRGKREGGGDVVEFMEPGEKTREVLPGVTVIKAGGHFPGSLLLHWEGRLLIADTVVTVPSALYHIDRPPGTTSYTFFWSIPNMIPLPPSEIQKIWEAIKPFDFDVTMGAFPGMDVRGKDVKRRLLESVKIQVRSEGWTEHEILSETV
ncbi:hypothetical protein K402DRAFT_398516 [Aulographum hederae CBS 113979]|uniref:Metallo-beta-lactamase domain-containing protein n=1 Tax=Aulographum hederae CBS 113979 TaxID=1176131 RepID=A0A6G1GKZ2_9PEZI|nr:hypothetical protein K402DRAFT_398516 [Aulographum hederae CBS 113979]